MTECAKLQDQLALYASGDLGDHERARVEAHLARCDACRRALAEMQAVVAAAAAQRVQPPDELGARIAGQINRMAPAALQPPARFRWPLALGYVGAVAVVFSAGVMVGLQLPGSKLHRYLTKVAQPPPAGGARSSAPVVTQARPTMQPQPPAETPQAAPDQASSSSIPDTAPLAQVVEPAPLKAPLPTSPDDVRLALLAQPEQAASARPKGQGRSDGAPSRGPSGPGVLRGRVTYNGEGVGGIHLRLLRPDGSFVPGAAATTDSAGNYEFLVCSGAYRVYAYVGDNPLYFNRCSAVTRMRRGAAAAPDLILARVLQPFEPRPGAELVAGSQVTFRWSPCPGAAEYTLTVVAAETGDTVFAARVSEAAASVPAGILGSDGEYAWQVRASGANGAFLGASPGAGGQRWTFAVRKR